MGGTVARNAALATEHTRRSAALGDVVGRTDLGIAFIKGEGVPQDIAEGERLLREVDAPYAHYWLGRLYAGAGPHPLDADYARRHLEIAAKGQVETSVLFELIGARYERRSLLVTANQPFGEWNKVFPDQATTPPFSK